ncbi:cytochrome P450 [Schizopora paradoxa]|uniref:Cytochrome P450 n=1 Tax=Schizopora paradoxa TaxID=27342 RepID=A0A0H2R9Q1_9AGAM|nr:cytochrome P450 [Schizopora paradoxa]
MDSLKGLLDDGLTIAGQHPIATLAAIGLSLKIGVDVVQKGRRGRLPPGPPSLPIIGNVLDFPTGLEAPHWAKHHAKYGPISSVNALGQTIIIVNDAKIASELLEKRSAVYSDRPHFVFGGDMCGFDGALTLLQTGENFKTTRKRMHGYIGSRAAVARFAELEEIETHRFLLHVLDKPDDFFQHIRTTAGAIILKISHGYVIKRDGKDAFVDLAHQVLDAFSVSLGSPWAVDILPSLKYLPSWLPGMGFKKLAHEYKKLSDALVKRPQAFIKHEMATGEARESFALTELRKGVKDAGDEHSLMWAASSLYGGGADTTVSAVSTFFLGVLLHPRVQKRAQEEIDSVIGNDRLPLLSDRPNLPYLEAVTKESLRWNSVVPMGVAHVSSKDDTYNGYFLPKGSIVMPNVWHMCHDPTVYHDPFEFKPERFLGTEGRAPEPDPSDLAFGFGRRICPGKDLADPSLFLSVAMTLAVFNINKAKDASGTEIEPLYEYTPGLISHPKEFKCSITPRSEKAVALIRSVEIEHPFEPSDSDKLANLSWE